MIYPKGKGWFIWNLIDGAIFNGNISKMVARLQELGANWVCVKVADGMLPANRRPITNLLGKIIGWDDSLLAQFTAACRAVGIEVWGWQYVYLLNFPIKEAEMAASRIKLFHLAGLLVDPEGEAGQAGPENTRQYCNALRAGLGMNVPIGLCSWRFPSLHPDLAWDEWFKLADFHCPQVYWVGATNPVQQLQRSQKELQAMFKVPYLPTGALYREVGGAYSGWKPTHDQVLAFANASKEAAYSGTLWWEWANAERYGLAEWFKEIPGLPLVPPGPVQPPASEYPYKGKTTKWFVWLYDTATAPRAKAWIQKPGTQVMVLERVGNRLCLQDIGWVEVGTIAKLVG